jgi:hypothetical protein
MHLQNRCCSWAYSDWLQLIRQHRSIERSPRAMQDHNVLSANTDSVCSKHAEERGRGVYLRAMFAVAAAVVVRLSRI